MKILKVIHGYPPRYSAGSEVYSKTLCHELVAEGHEVVVFAREENAYKREYTVTWEEDPDCPLIRVCLINMAHSKDGYRHSAVDLAFRALLEEISPDVVHVGHLNHLSTSILHEIKMKEIPLVFTLHDFWLMCPRGQFLQAANSKTSNLYPACDSQENRKCAMACYSRYFSSDTDQDDLEYWTRWVEKRMEHVRKMADLVDLFIAPSKYLMGRFIDAFGIPKEKIVYLDYGFDREGLQLRERADETPFVFGYIGTHKQAKGIHHLIEAFGNLRGNLRLRIWGNPIEPFTSSLRGIIQSFDEEIQANIEWRGGYKNEAILLEVFNHVDAIVVPSIWGENSPLVIHEAIEAGVPIITANYGGMSEYVQDGVNGLLFEHRNVDSLITQMEKLYKNPELGERLGRGGYLQSEDGHIPSVKEHVKDVCLLYQQVQKIGV